MSGADAASTAAARRPVSRTALGVALLFVIVNALFTSRAVVRLVDAQDAATQATALLEATSRLRTLVDDARAGRRDYSTNGQTSDLNQFLQARQRVPGVLQEVIDLSTGRAWEEDALEALRNELQAWLEHSDPLPPERRGTVDPVRDARDRSIRYARLERIRQILSDHDQAELDALEELRQQSQRIGRRSVVFVFAQAGLSLILLVVIAGLGDRERRQAEQQAEELARRVDGQTRMLRTRAEQLESALADRARAVEELEELSEELERSNRELNDFAFIASHDLQEPLRKVRAFADLVARRYSDALDERGQDYLKRLSNAAERMSTLIEDLLRLSRVARNPPSLGTVELRALVDEIVELTDVRREELDGTVTIEGWLPEVDADPAQLRQLFLNLISNGLKFHRDGVPPEVAVTGEAATLDGRDAVRITVADNGIGIDEKYHDRIFGAFQRLHGRSEYEGTGIGLAVVRRVVERHDGTIEVSSVVGEGTTMLITLPLRHGDEDDETTTADEPLYRENA